MSITGKASSKTNTFCIQYWHLGSNEKPKVLRRINTNGVVISAKKYSEVFMYSSLQDTWQDSTWLIENGYDIKIRKCNKGKNDTFWLM
ncbi:hypothetical protein S-PM2d188 [Synechococcus phage S-PM2]|uniref:Hypothetical-Protein / belonging to T4-LIKE GC: 871 n=1 Tax=Synechococcus phage S-PM2 TaxID=238854 RepID=Q5GQE9_BPSYP|nr:Hypothetical-Protein / belonging to T4-LIKE GC: 871 [Synechococcus phage S-PM2]CAF34253.1 Hypothetical-Protein / belonging to T4-LIKE GC: 871 [Synechococcus phage S-PM2]CFW42399.1 hypothetical protein S-PM2d188 [Synechococcus phage S-PM2]